MLSSICKRQTLEYIHTLFFSFSWLTSGRNHKQFLRHTIQTVGSQRKQKKRTKSWPPSADDLSLRNCFSRRHMPAWCRIHRAFFLLPLSTFPCPSFLWKILHRPFSWPMQTQRIHEIRAHICMQCAHERKASRKKVHAGATTPPPPPPNPKIEKSPFPLA